MAALIYFNLLSRDTSVGGGIETLYSLLKIDLLDDEFLKSGFIDEYIAEEIQSNKYKIEDEFRLLYLYAMYSTSPDRFNRLVEYVFSKRGELNYSQKCFSDFAEDVLKLKLPESSSVIIKRFQYFLQITFPQSSVVLEENASEVLNTLNELMVKDSIINNLNGFSMFYLSLSDKYLKRLMEKKTLEKQLSTYNELYDKVSNKNMLLRVAPEILRDLSGEISCRLSKGNVTQALPFYTSLKQLKGDPIRCSNVYFLSYTLEALYNAARDKGMVNVARDIRKTISSMKQPNEVITM